MVVARPESRKAGRLGLAALALMVVAVGGWFLLKGPKGTRLSIESRPVGAKVFVNDLAVGNTPTNQPLTAGDKLRLEAKGYEPFAYEFKPGEPPPAFALKPIITEELLDSAPQGARVVLDQRQLEGVTPMKVSWNHGLPHQLTLTKDRLGCAKDFEPSEVPAGKVFELKEAATASTMPEPPLDPKAAGALKLAGDFGVRLTVDGKAMGELSPGGKLPLTPGKHKLELSNSRYFYKDTKDITVIAGQTATFTVPGLATLTVGTHPGVGKVYVDNVDTGIESDGSSVQVARGRHLITVRGAKGNRAEKSLDVTGDTPLDLPL
jgi:hypothetical protein